METNAVELSSDLLGLNLNMNEEEQKEADPKQ